MNRLEKEKQVKDLREKFSSSTVAIFTEFSGMSVEEMTDLRKKLRKANAELRVVKNTLAVRAAEGTPAGEAVSAFEGPVAVAFGYSDPVPAAKVVKEFSDKKDLFKIKMGVIDGCVVDSNNIKYFAQLPSRDVLLTQIVSQLQAPLASVVWVLGGLFQQLVGTLDSIKEKKSSTTA